MSATTDVEVLISRLCGPLDPDARLAFRQAAEAILAAPNCWGDGLIYRTLVPLWRVYFHPPPDERAGWDIEREPRRSKLIDQPPIQHGRDRRRSRSFQIVG